MDTEERERISVQQQDLELEGAGVERPTGDAAFPTSDRLKRPNKRPGVRVKGRGAHKMMAIPSQDHGCCGACDEEP